MNDFITLPSGSNYYVFFTREGQFSQIKVLTDEQYKYARKTTNMFIFACSGQLLRNLVGLQKRFYKAISQFNDQFVKEI